MRNKLGDLTPMTSYNNDRCQDIDDNVGSNQNKLMCRKRYCSFSTLNSPKKAIFQCNKKNTCSSNYQ